MLLRFHAPEYAMDDDRGSCAGGSATASSSPREGHEGDGYLEIDVQRCPDDAPGRARMHVEVEIASFYPALALRIARWFYANTQSRIHVLVTHGFLRSLARLELEESAVGRFAEPRGRPRRRRRPAGEPVNVGDTPWPVVGALAGAARRRGARAAAAPLRQPPA